MDKGNILCWGKDSRSVRVVKSFIFFMKLFWIH